MAYVPILDTEIDAESPITESLMTRLRDNILAFAQDSYTEITGSGNYTVPSDVTLLRVIMIGGGGGGGGGGASQASGGGGSGCVILKHLTTTGGASISYACGAGGAGGSSGGTVGSNGGNTTFGALTAQGGPGSGVTTSIKPDQNPVTNKLLTFYLSGGDGGATGSGTAGGDAYSYPAVNAGVPGSGGAAGGSEGGGGGAPCGIPFELNTTSLGNGGNGGDHSLGGSNATNYGAGGGGGGGNNTTGGNGSGGIIFVQPVG